MLSNYLGKQLVYRVFLFCYIVLAIALPFNKLVLSLASVLLFLFTLLDFSPKRDIEKIKTNKSLLLLFLFLGIHLISFFWSSNQEYFLKDLTVKLPLYALPLVLVLHPLQSSKELLSIFNCFILSVTFFSIYNFITFFSGNSFETIDIRYMSQFVSHIRFGLMIVFAIVLSLYQVFFGKKQWPWAYYLITIWLLIYTHYAEVMSAYASIVLVIACSIVFIFFKSFSKGKAIIYSSILALSFCSLGVLFYLFFLKAPESPKIGVNDKYTAEGNSYKHNLNSHYYINNNHVYSFICDEELHREWKNYSKHNLTDTNRYGYQHYYTLVQYMTSKGLRKDARGFQELSPLDLKRIEAGLISDNTLKPGFGRRLETLRNEFYDDDPNGKTLKQRIEFVCTGWKIFLNNPFLGVGSGDLADAFTQQYKIDKTRLKKVNQLRAHNQFLSYFISFGILGGVVFLILMGYSFFYFVRRSDWPATLFLGLLLFSFLSEDTLETQVGVTFFALFYGIFVSSSLSNKYKDEV